MRERIIQAFIEETRQNGIKFTMDELARRLGISKRTLYEHFSSKLEILQTIIDKSIREMDERSHAIREDSSLSLEEKIRETILVIPIYSDFFDLRILEQLKRYFPAQWEQVHQEMSQWDDLEFLLKQGMDSGLIKHQNMDLLMKMILNVVNITLDQQFFSEQSISVNEAIETMNNLLLHGLIETNG